MSNEHPITLPPDKFKRWEEDILNERENIDVVLDCAWKDGYRAGADAELEACCEWLVFDRCETIAGALQAARRPKPPSLAEDALNTLGKKLVRFVDPEGYDTIRRALERLQELEKGNE